MKSSCADAHAAMARRKIVRGISPAKSKENLETRRCNIMQIVCALLSFGWAILLCINKHLRMNKLRGN